MDDSMSVFGSSSMPDAGNEEVDADAGKKEETPDDKIVRRLARFLRDNASECRKEHKRMEGNHNFIASTGDQWSVRDRKKAERLRQPALNLNESRLVIEALAGKETTARFQAVLQPFDESIQDAAFADVCNEYIRRVRFKCEAEEEESEAFRELSTSGYCFLSVWPDFSVGRYPRIRIEEVPPWEVIWDTRARKRCMKDTEGVVRMKWISRTEFVRRFPEHRELLKKAALNDGLLKWPGLGDSFGGSEETGGRRPYIYFEESFYNKKRKEILVMEYQWPEQRHYLEMDLPLDIAMILVEEGDLILEPSEALPPPPPPPEPTEDGSEPIPPEQPIFSVKRPEKEAKAIIERVSELLGEAGPFDDYLPVQEPDNRVAFVCAGKVLESHSLETTTFTIGCGTGYPHRKQEVTTFYGQADVMKDPQAFVNRFGSLYIDLMAKLPKASWTVQKGTENVAQIEEKIAKGGQVIELSKPDGMNPLPQPPKPPVEEGMELFRQMLIRFAGFNPYSLGQVEDLKRTAGSAIASVTQTTNAYLATLFDSMRTIRKFIVRVVLEYMIQFEDEESLARIVGELKAQGIPPKSEWKKALDFDIVIDETQANTNNATRIWEIWAQNDMWAKIAQFYGPPPIDVFMGMLPGDYIGAVNKAKWIADYKQKQADQAAQAAQQAQQPQQQPQGGGGEQPPQQ